MIEKGQNSAELCHHGVKGMKWGRRKAVQRSPSLRSRTSSTLTQREQERIVRSGNPNTVKKHAHQLSDRNLRRAMERIDTAKSLGELKTKHSVSDISRDVRRAARSVKYLASIYDTYTQLSNKMGRQTGGQKRRAKEEAKEIAKEARDARKAARKTARRYDRTLKTSDRVQDKRAKRDLRRRGRVNIGSGDNMRTFGNYSDYRNYMRGERQIRRRRLREARR